MDLDCNKEKLFNFDIIKCVNLNLSLLLSSNINDLFLFNDNLLNTSFAITDNSLKINSVYYLECIPIELNENKKSLNTIKNNSKQFSIVLTNYNFNYKGCSDISNDYKLSINKNNITNRKLKKLEDNNVINDCNNYYNILYYNNKNCLKYKCIIDNDFLNYSIFNSDSNLFNGFLDLPVKLIGYFDNIPQYRKKDTFNNYKEELYYEYCFKVIQIINDMSVENNLCMSYSNIINNITCNNILKYKIDKINDVSNVLSFINNNLVYKFNVDNSLLNILDEIKYNSNYILDLENYILEYINIYLSNLSKIIEKEICSKLELEYNQFFRLLLYTYIYNISQDSNNYTNLLIYNDNYNYSSEYLVKINKLFNKLTNFSFKFVNYELLDIIISDIEKDNNLINNIFASSHYIIDNIDYSIKQRDIDKKLLNNLDNNNTNIKLYKNQNKKNNKFQDKTNQTNKINYNNKNDIISDILLNTNSSKILSTSYNIHKDSNLCNDNLVSFINSNNELFSFKTPIIINKETKNSINNVIAKEMEKQINYKFNFSDLCRTSNKIQKDTSKLKTYIYNKINNIEDINNSCNNDDYNSNKISKNHISINKIDFKNEQYLNNKKDIYNMYNELVNIIRAYNKLESVLNKSIDSLLLDKNINRNYILKSYIKYLNNDYSYNNFLNLYLSICVSLSNKLIKENNFNNKEIKMKIIDKLKQLYFEYKDNSFFNILLYNKFEINLNFIYTYSISSSIFRLNSKITNEDIESAFNIFIDHIKREICVLEQTEKFNNKILNSMNTNNNLINNEKTNKIKNKNKYILEKIKDYCKKLNKNNIHNNNNDLYNNNNNNNNIFNAKDFICYLDENNRQDIIERCIDISEIISNLNNKGYLIKLSCDTYKLI